MHKKQMIMGTLLVAVLLVLGACTAGPATTVTTPTTAPTTVKPTIAPTTAKPTTAPTTAKPTITAPTAQPQVITSPDGKLQITQHKGAMASTTMPTVYVVQGLVKNISTTTVSGEIKIEFYGANGILITTQGLTVSDIVAGESRSFEIRQVNAPIVSYRITLNTKP